MHNFLEFLYTTHESVTSTCLHQTLRHVSAETKLGDIVQPASLTVVERLKHVVPRYGIDTHQLASGVNWTLRVLYRERAQVNTFCLGMCDALENKEDVSCTKRPLSLDFDIEKCSRHFEFPNEFQRFIAFVPLHTLRDVSDMFKYQLRWEIEIGIDTEA